MSARILALPGGRLVRASDPYPGSVHDVAALDASGLLEGIDPSGWIADKGYVGRGMITPHKKPPNGELSEAAKEANKSINKIRQVVERTIAHIKAWRILHTDHRRPPAHIRADHHRRPLTPRLQNHPLNKLPWTTCVPLDDSAPTVVLEGGMRISASGAQRRRAPRSARSSGNRRARHLTREHVPLADVLAG